MHGHFRSSAYDHYHVRCNLNTTTWVVWLAFSYAMHSACPPFTAPRRFDTSRGTRTLCKDSELHVQESNNRRFEGSHQLIRSNKRRVCKGAVDAVVCGHLPLIFNDKKPGMTRFPRALVQVGQTVPIGHDVDIEHMLPKRSGRDAVCKRECRIIMQHIQS